MPNSIRTTSNTQITTLATNQATFAIGDLVLCPSLSNTLFVLTADPYVKRDDLTLEFEGSYFYYDGNGYFIRASQEETDDFQPSLYHDTTANRQAIATLYNGRFTTQTSQRTVINTTEADDKETVLVSAFDLRDIACDIEGAITTLDDIGQLLHLIYQNKITHSQALSMARLSHDAANTWAALLISRLENIKKPLAQSTFGIEVSS